MRRNFCIYCHAPLALDAQGQPLPCPCDVTPEQLQELEEREREHLAEYGKAHFVTTRDISRNVESERGIVPVIELLRQTLHDESVVEAYPVKATDDGLIQLVYVKGQGSKLLKWPFR